MVLARFLPRNERFFDYFRDAVSNAHEVAQLLVEMLENYDDVERKVRRMRDLERRGDQITHQIFNALNRTFVTPLDREDISNLASRIDDFVDYIEETARRMWLYRIDQPTEPARMPRADHRQQAVLIGEAIPYLRNLKRSDTRCVSWWISIGSKTRPTIFSITPSPCSTTVRRTSRR